jgi:hypothetical protein
MRMSEQFGDSWGRSSRTDDLIERLARLLRQPCRLGDVLLRHKDGGAHEVALERIIFEQEDGGVLDRFALEVFVLARVDQSLLLLGRLHHAQDEHHRIFELGLVADGRDNGRERWAGRRERGGGEERGGGGGHEAT